jgi:hypothetical protein
MKEILVGLILGDLYIQKNLKQQPSEDGGLAHHLRTDDEIVFYILDKELFMRLIFFTCTTYSKLIAEVLRK